MKEVKKISFNKIKNALGVSKSQKSDEPHNTTYVAESQKLIFIAQEVLIECDDFLTAATKIIRSESKANRVTKKKFDPLHVSAAIHKWRVKKKGHKIFAEYDNLVGRTNEVDKEMRGLIDECVKDCSALILQSEHIQARITACIKFNENQVKILKPVITKNKQFLDLLLKEKKAIAAMLDFYDEVQYLKETQVLPYVPWTERVSQTIVAPSPQKREPFERRLNLIAKISDVVDKAIQVHNPTLTLADDHFKHCCRSMNALVNLSKKISYYRSIVTNGSDHNNGAFGSVEQIEGPPSPVKRVLSVGSDECDARSSGAASGSLQDSLSLSSARRHSVSEFSPEKALEEALVAASDSVECEVKAVGEHPAGCDCSLVYMMANECAMHLAASQHFAQEGSMCLQRLYQTRERMLEAIHQLEELDVDGDHPFHHHDA